MSPPASNDTGTALSQDGSDWSWDLATLTFDLGGHSVCGWCGSSSSVRIPSLKFVGLGVRKIWHTMCVSINGPGDLDLWPFDLETGMRVASKVGNLPSKFGHASALGSRIIRYVRDGWTDGRTKATVIPGGGITVVQLLHSLHIHEHRALTSAVRRHSACATLFIIYCWLSVSYNSRYCQSLLLRYLILCCE